MKVTYLSTICQHCLLLMNMQAGWNWNQSGIRYSCPLLLSGICILSCELFITPKYQTMYEQCIKFFCMNNVRLKTIELLDTYYEKRQLEKWHTFGNYSLSICVYTSSSLYDKSWIQCLLTLRLISDKVLSSESWKASCVLTAV